MTRWAACSPSVRQQTQLVLAALGAAMVVLSCSGGGGGGPPPPGGGPQDCGSPAGSTRVVVCGFVVTADALRQAVANAAVTLKTSTGVSLATTNTRADGFYIFDTVPANAALFQVDPPAPGFFQNFAKFPMPSGGLYYYTIQNQARTGPCIMALPALPNGDTKLGDVGVYSAFGGPPPPPLGCPR